MIPVNFSSVSAMVQIAAALSAMALILAIFLLGKQRKRDKR